MPSRRRSLHPPVRQGARGLAIAQFFPRQIALQILLLIAQDRARGAAVAEEATRVRRIDGIAEDVAVEIGITAEEPDRVLRRPASSLRVIVSRTEMDQFGIAIGNRSGG